MRNVKAKNSLIVERGAKKTLKVFKPLVASSLALALGVSVGNALPVLTNTSNGGDTVIDPTGTIWTTEDGNDYYKFTDNSDKTIYFSADTGSPVYQWKTTDANELQIGGMTTFTLSADKGISMNGGVGTLTISMWLGSGRPAHTFTLNLSSIDKQYYAIRGGLTIDQIKDDSARNTFVALLGGKGIYGSLTLQSSGTSNLTFTNDTSSIGGGISVSNGTTNINSNNLAISGGINISNGTTSIVANDLTITNNADTITTTGGTLNITANNLVLRRSNNGSALWSKYGTYNITIRDGGSFSTYKNNNNTLTNISIEKTSRFTMNFEGNATINSIFQGNNVITNTITMNFGRSTSNNTNSHNVVFKGSFYNNGNGADKPFTSIFNFQNDNFAFALQDANGVAQGITYSNTRSNAINFNANNGVFDLGTNALNVSGTLGINLANSGGTTRTATTNTIKSSSITTSGSGATTLTFNADNSTLKLNDDGNGTISTQGGTSTINFNSTNGVLAGAVSTSGGTTTIKVADTKSGTINGAVTTNGGSTNINFDTNSIGDKTLTLGASGNSITGITFGSAGTETSTNNTLVLSQGDTSIVNVVDIEANQGLAFDLEEGVNLTLLAHLTNAGTSEINFNGNNGTLTSNVTTSGGITAINFKGANGILTGEVETSGGNTTINIADSSSGTINGNISTPNGQVTLATIAFASGNGNKSLRLNGSSNALESITLRNTSTNNSLILSGGTTTISDSTTIVNGNSLNIVFEGSNTNFRNNILNSGIANINFNGSSGWFMQGIKTLGSNSAVTTINISNGSKGEIQGSITTTQGSTNINFGAGSDSKTLTLDASSNLTGITFGGNSTENTLIIIDNATITNTTSVNANQALTFALNQLGASLTNTLANNGGNLRVAFNKDMTSFTGDTSTSAGTTTIDFNDNGNIAGAVSTTGGSTTISIADSKSGTISGAVSTSNDGSTTISFADGSNAKTLNLQGTNNTITSITSGGSNNTLKLDTTSNAVSVGVTNAVLGADSLSIAMGGKTSNKAELTLNNANGDSTLKAITLTETTSAVGDNVLNLNANKTTITDNLSITSGQGMTINLAGNSVELASGITNQGATNLNFNGSAGTLTGAVSTTAGTTTISVANGKSGSITGAITTDSGATTTIKFAEGSEAKSLTLGQDANTLTNIAFGNGTSASSSNNTLTLTGSTTITSATTIGTNQGLTFDLVNANINLTNNISNTGGSTILNYNGDNGTLTGSVSTSDGATALNFNQSGRITQGVSTSGGATTISIGNTKTATIDNITSQNYGIGTSSGETTINFDGASTLAGAISTTTSGTTTFNLGSSNSSTALATISGAITNSATNIFNINATTTTLKNGDNGLTFSGGTNTINFANTSGSTLTWQNSNRDTQDISTRDGTTNINFSNNGVITGGINTDGGTTTISIADGKSGTISGAVRTTGGSTNIDFASGNNAKSLTLGAGDNTITGITLGSNSTANTLILNSGKTEITGNASVASNQGLTFNLAGDSVELDSDIANANLANLLFNGSNGTLTGTISTTGGTTTISIADGKSGTITGAVTTSGGATNIDFASGNNAKSLTLGAGDNTITGITLGSNSTANTLVLSTGTTTISTNTDITTGQALTFDLKDSVNLTNAISNTGGSANLEFNGSAGKLTGTIDTSSNGTTTIQIADSKYGTITGAISTTGGITNINFLDGDSSKSLNLQGANNAITTITSGGSGNNTLSLDTTLNGVSAEVSNAIVGDNLTISMGGKTSNKAELTLNNTDGNSTIKALSLASSSAVGENVLNLNANKTTISDDLSIDSSKGLTINLADSTELASGITNQGATKLNFNGSNGILTGTISTSNNGTTTISIANDRSGTISGAVTTTDGATNISFAEGSDKKSLTLGAGNNTITGITLGNNSTANTLILNSGKTEITGNASVASNQGLTFNLAGDSVELDSNISNENIANLNFNGSDGLLTGTIGTSNNGTTTISVANGKSGTISGEVTTDSGATTTINFVDGSNAKSLNLQGVNNTITTITSGGSGNNTLSLDTALNGVSVGVTDAISGNNLTISMGGTTLDGTKKVASLTLNNADTDSTIKAITLTNSSAVGENVLSLGANKTTITDNLSIDSDKGLTINLDNAELASGITNLGSAIVNFNGTTSSKLTGNISTNGSSKTTTFNVANSDKGFVNGNITLSEDGVNNVNIGNDGTLTLQGENNQLTSVSSTTSGTLKLDGTSNANGVSASVSNAIENSTTTLNFNGSTGRKAEMTLASGDNELKAITLGSDATNNTLILSQGSTSIQSTTNISENQTLSFDLRNGVNLTNEIGNTGGTTNLEFNGTNGILTGTLNTTAGTTTISIADNKSGTITGAVTTSGGATNIDFVYGSNAKSLNLQGSDNQITTITSDGSENTLTLDTIRNAVSVEVSNAISGANNLTIALGGKTGGIANLTLNNTDGNSTIKALTFGNGATNNIINLSQNNTSITDYVSLTSGQGATFNLNNNSNLAFAKNIANTSSLESLVFNIKGTNTISGDITIGDDSISDAITTFNVADSSTGIIVGNIFTRDNNSTNITIGNGGTLTLQGENNQLTSVSSTTSGTLKLDGASNENGVSASVSSAIIGNTTTLNFNGSTGKKAEMTLIDRGNQIKAITLGSNAVENKLILSQGSTSVTEEVSVGENQALAFDLADGTTLTFTNDLSNTEGKALFNIKDGASSTIVGSILNDAGTNNVSFVGTGTLTLRGAENKLTNVSSTTSGTLSLDGNGSTGGVNASVSSAITGNTTTLDFNGTTDKKAEITLGASGNTLKAITLGSGATNNTLILSQGTTSVNDTISVGTSQALAFDLANGTTLTFTNNLSNTGGEALFNVKDDASSTIVGSILNPSGTNNVTIGENGTLTLRGTTNQLTEVSSTTSGTLKLDGTSNANGVSASVSSAITTDENGNSTTTLNFNGASGKKAEMTLASGGNELKAITLGKDSTANKLILSIGDTSIQSATTIANNQALTFDLADNVNLTNNISNAGTTNLEFNGSAGTLTGAISTSAGTTTISIADEKSGTITGAVTTTDGATTTINFADGSNAKSLNLQGANNTITTITSGGSGNNTLSLDTTSNGVNAKVSNAIAGDNLTISMGGTTLDGTSKVTELTLNNIGGDSTLKALALTGTTSAVGDNVLNLNANKTTISDGSGISIGSGKGLTINLADSTELASGVANQGATNLNFNGSDGILTGTIGTDGANAITTIKIADGKSGTISGAVTTTDGTTNISFAEGSNKKSLTLGAGGNTITGIVLGSNPSTNNILALNNGATTISNAVSVGTNQALAFTLNDNTTLDFTDGLTTDATGTTTFNLGSNDASATTTTLVGTITNNGTNTFNVNSATTTLKYDSGLAFSSGVNEINFTNTSENGATLNWRNTSDETNQAITTSGGTTQINFTNNGTISGGVSTSDSGSTTLAISNGKTATIDGISTLGGTTTINFNGESGTLTSAISTTGGTTSINISDNAVATITGNITTGTIPSGNKARAMRIEDTPAPTPAPATNIAFNSTKTGEKLSKSTLILQGSTNQITTLTMGAGENILALMQNGEKQEYTDRNATIENLDNTANGKLRLVSQISTNDANTFTINNAIFSTSKEAEVNQDDAQQNTPKLTGHISLILSDGVDTNQVGKESAILVASVKDGIGVAFEETSEFADGFLIKEATFTTNDDGDYTNYFLGSITTRGIANSEQKAIASAFMLDYNLYMANLNSLNRRMGELRENAHSQGVWARVFNGGLSNEFGLGSKSNYTTIQAGYDYAFGSEGANNYLGFALSYALSFATSDSKATDSATGEVVGLDNIYSNAVEVALYNSYVSDSGWYNDTIAKFSYIMSSFDIQAGGVSEARASDTKNYALTLSNEVGYAIRFGEMSEWSITPQVEATFGYFSQSDFKQNLSDNTQYLDSKAESVLTLRARAGSAFTYDFRAFTQKSGFNASLYVGAFYEYDYVNGGDISMVVSDGTTETQKSDIGSDGRVVMNVGTNMTIQDNTRLYFDFEKSFMGKINTDYQVNFGVRYSFGESDGYTPILEKSDYKAPLKIEGEESKEEDKEVKEGEEKQGEDKVKEGEKKEKTQKSKDEGSKSASKESKNTKTTKTLAKTQPKGKPSK